MFFHVIIGLGFIVISAFIGGLFARLVKIPTVIGYIVSGVLSAFLYNYLQIPGVQFSDLLVYVASFLLFTVGIEIPSLSFKVLNRKVILVGLIHVLFVSLFLFPLLMFFQFPVQTSLFFAFILSFSSTAYVLKALEEQGKLTEFPGNHVLAFLLLQNIIAIFAVYTIPIIFSKQDVSLQQIGSAFGSLIAPIGVFVALLLFYKIFLSKIIRSFQGYPTQELTFLWGVLLVLISLGLFQFAGLPFPFSALCAGIVLSADNVLVKPIHIVQSIRNILLIFFLVLIGMVLDVSFLVQHIGYLTLLTCLIIVCKFCAVYFTLRNSGYRSSGASFIATHMTSVGELAVVIGVVAVSSTSMLPDTYNVLLIIFALSTIISSVLVKNVAYIGRFLDAIPVINKLFGKEHRSVGIESADVFEDHVILCGYGRIGPDIKAVLDYAGITYVVIDTNRKSVKKLIAENKKALFGDPSDKELMKHASVQSARAVIILRHDNLSQEKIIKYALSQNQHITVISSVHDDTYKYDLANLGVNSIVVPEFEASVRIGREVLEMFSIKEADIATFIKRLRRENFLK